MNPKERGKELSRLFFNNINYLRKKRSISIVSVVSGIESKTGYRIGRHSIRLYRAGKLERADISYLAMFADYFNEPLSRLLSVDYEAEDLLKGSK